MAKSIELVRHADFKVGPIHTGRAGDAPGCGIFESYFSRLSVILGYLSIQL